MCPRFLYMYVWLYHQLLVGDKTWCACIIVQLQNELTFLMAQMPLWCPILIQDKMSSRELLHYCKSGSSNQILSRTPAIPRDLLDKEMYWLTGRASIGSAAVI